VTLPGRTLDEIRAQAALALAAGADLGEVRFDRWSDTERLEASRLFPSALPLVATLRSKAEGGEGPDVPEERAALLERLAGLPFAWIDLEAARDEPLASRIAATRPRGVILSTHFLEGVPASDLQAALTGVAPPGALRKIVAPASVELLLTELLPLVGGSRGPETVVLTTGPSGPLLRAWSRRFDFPVVYASLPLSPRTPELAPVEPSQIPVDRLRHFFGGEPSAPLFALLGHPVAHSRSPALHSRWMQDRGDRGLYIALDIAVESELVGALDPLAAEGFRGLNVTHPWKSAALEAATEVAPGAETCGAASCLTLRDGEILAENTDLAAVLRRFEEFRKERIWDGGELAVLGTGGSAAATLAAAREVGATAHVFARDARAAKAITERFGARIGLRPEARPFPLVVNATDVGRAGAGPLEVPLAELVGPETRVLDWVYAPDESTIHGTCTRAQGTYEDGWRLLVYQAAASYGLWWGSEPDPEQVATAVAEGP
jgi:shikimate dehydrogenase